MTKLLIATGIFHPESGGPATYLYHLLPHLQQQGYHLHVLTYGDPDPERDAAYPYPVTRVPRTPLPFRMAAYAHEAQKLLTWADAVYVHTLGLPLLHRPLEKRVPRVVKIVGDQAWERSIRRGWVPATTDIDRFQILRYRHPLVQMGKRARRNEVRQMDGVIVPSDYLRRMVSAWGVPTSRIKMIYNALPPEIAPLKMSQAEARAKLHLDPHRPLILTAARLVPWKGIDDFILAINAVSQTQLLIAGDGEMRGELEQFAREYGLSERVTFLGRVPREQMPVYMRAADYVGLYSGYEGLSHVLLESLRVGTPVIASNKGGNPELIGHEVNGLLVPYENTIELSRALVKAFQPGMRDRLAANTALGMEKFDHDRMVLETIGALEQFFHMNGGPRR